MDNVLLEIGQIKTAKELGRVGFSKYIWTACEFCGKRRWVQLVKGKPVSSSCLLCGCKKRRKSIRGKVKQKCLYCSKEFETWPREIEKGKGQFCSKSCVGKHHTGAFSRTWRGGRNLDKRGYVKVWITPDDFFWPMAVKNRNKKAGYVLEHRLVIARALGRCLQPWEFVHHKGIRYSSIENKSDNLEDNLERTGSLGEHSANHSKGYADGYAKGLRDGKNAKIRKLEAQIKELSE